MPHPHYVRHIKIRSELLRAMIHEAWKLGNDSMNIHSQPEGETERRKDVLDLMVKHNFAEIRE